jgi:hypothetical protein
MSNCPDYLHGCKEAAERQRELTPSERQRITGPASEYSDHARMCSYCGLVYARSPLPKTQRLGWLDGMMGLGFTAAVCVE